MTCDCLRSVFESLQNSEAPKIKAEVILIDNASEDGSADTIEREFPNVVLIRNQENKGFAAANNQGFEISKGRHILLLNSDTLVHGDALSASVAYMDKNLQVGALGIKALNADGTTQMTCQQFPSLLNMFLMASGLWKLKWPKFFGRYHMTDWQRDTEREVEVISGCYLLVRREILDQVGPFDEGFFFFGEETDWCDRMRRVGWILMFSPIGTFTHYGSVSAKKLSHKRDILLAGSKVRLHRKKSIYSAAVAWVIVALFNCSRAVFWSIRSLFDNGTYTKQRAKHFRAVVCDLSVVWRGGI